jgi:hypothetical protein
MAPVHRGPATPALLGLGHGTSLRERADALASSGVRWGAVTLLTLVALAAPATAAAPVTLKIVFPEGFTVRRMADQVSAVRKIAIRRRHVTRVRTGRAYAVAAQKAAPPPAFRRDDTGVLPEGQGVRLPLLTAAKMGSPGGVAQLVRASDS